MGKCAYLMALGWHNSRSYWFLSGDVEVGMKIVYMFVTNFNGKA
jgi:hypothetical protein